MQRSSLFLLPLLAIAMMAPTCGKSPDKGDLPDTDSLEVDVESDTGTIDTGNDTSSDTSSDTSVDTDTDTNVQLTCNGPFSVWSTDNVEYTVLTRPHFAKSVSNPVGAIVAGGGETLHVDVTADGCGALTITHLVAHLACSDNANTGWANFILTQAWRFGASVQGDPSIQAYPWLYDVDPNDSTEASMQIEFVPPITLAAGETKTIVYGFDSTGSSEQLSDWVKMIQDPRLVWYGNDNPNSYPSEGWIDDELPITGETLQCQDP